MLIDHSGGTPIFRAIDQGLSLSEPLRPRGAVLLAGQGPALLFPEELLPYVDWSQAVETLDTMDNMASDDIGAILEAMPTTWDIGPDDRTDVLDFLMGRRAGVRQLVEEEARRQ